MILTLRLLPSHKTKDIFKLVFTVPLVSIGMTCSNFDMLLNNVNDELPLCSMVTSNFNARCSR